MIRLYLGAADDVFPPGTRSQVLRLTAIHPFAIPCHTCLDVAVQSAKQSRPHEAHVKVPGPEAFFAKAR